MKFSISLTGRNKNIPSTMSDTEINNPDNNVMPIESPASTVPAEVTVMPITVQEQGGFFQELHSILFHSRLKVAIPKDGTAHIPHTTVSSGKELPTLSIGLFAALAGSVALSAISTKELRADDTVVVRYVQKSLTGMKATDNDSTKTVRNAIEVKAFQGRHQKVRGKLDNRLNRDVDGITHKQFFPKWSFVTMSLDQKGLTSEREASLLCPSGYIYRYDPQTRTVRVALPTRYLVTVANLPFVLRMSADLEGDRG